MRNIHHPYGAILLNDVWWKQSSKTDINHRVTALMVGQNTIPDSLNGLWWPSHSHLVSVYSFSTKGPDEKTESWLKGTAGRYNRYSTYTRICIKAYSNVFAPFLSNDTVCHGHPSGSRLCVCMWYVCLYKKILICEGMNVFWAQVISLDFVFQHSSLSQEIHSPWNISGQTQRDTQWPTAFHCAAVKLQPRLRPPLNPVAVLWGFELFGPSRGSVLCFQNSIFMVTNWQNKTGESVVFFF